MDESTYYSLTDEDTKELLARYVALLKAALDFAILIHNSCPPSRERSVALRKLEEVVMFANASIARREEKS